MYSLSDHRHSKGFTGKLKYSLNDPNQGLDYASTLKYNQSRQKQKLEEQQYLKHFIRTCKQAGQTFQQRTRQNLNNHLSLINNPVLNLSDSLLSNPLIGSLLKTKCLKPKALKKPDKNFVKLSKTSNLFYKQPDKQKINQNNRKAVQNRQTIREKKFIKYPSSSLLYKNPDQYKQNIEIEEPIAVNSDSQQSNQERLKSLSEKFKRTTHRKAYTFSRAPQKKQKKRQFSEPSDTSTAYCSFRNKYFKEKVFFDEKIIYLKKKKNGLMTIPLSKINNQVAIQVSCFIQARLSKGAAIQSNKIIENLEQNNWPSKKFQQKFTSQVSNGNMSRVCLECQKIQKNDTERGRSKKQSKIYIKCWSNGKNHQAQNIYKIKQNQFPITSQNNASHEKQNDKKLSKQKYVPRFVSSKKKIKAKTVT